jgi:membrane associated rhomboid family serine protease
MPLEPFNFRTRFILSRPPFIALAWIAVSAALTWGCAHAEAPAWSDRFVDWGAKSNAALLEGGEWWRLLTANWLHVSAFHLGFNALILLTFGGALESLYRRSDALLVFLACALATTIASALAADGIALGSSGVAIGCICAAAVFALRHRALLETRYRLLFLALGPPHAAANVMLGYRTAGVDNAGHFGGALAGGLCGLWLEPRFLATPRLPSLGWLFVLPILGMCAWHPAANVAWSRIARPADDVAIALPETFSLSAQGPHYVVYENELGTSVVIETSDAEPLRDALARFTSDTLRQLRESEDVRALATQPSETQIAGGEPALVLPLQLTGPRGEMQSWHVWARTRMTLVHAVWTCRKARAAQNEALFRTWLSHFSFN